MAELVFLCKVQSVVDDKKVIELIKKLYGFDVQSIEELNGYNDKNYHVLCYPEHNNNYINSVAVDGYVLKIINSIESQDENFLRGQNEMMLYLNKCNVICPTPVQNLHGSYYSLEKLHEEDTTYHAVKLLVYCPGEILHTVKIREDLLYDVGKFAAHLNETLRGFIYPPYQNRVHIWNLLAVPRLRDYLFVIKDNEDKLLIQDIINSFEKQVIGKSDKLEHGMIHGDLNEQNILVNAEHNKVIGIIDFGDTQYSYLIFELAIALCYMIIQTSDVSMGKHVIAGFECCKKLSTLEKRILKVIVCARICQSLILGIYTHLNDSHNDYLLLTQKSGWKILRKLWFMSDYEVSTSWSIQ